MKCTVTELAPKSNFVLKMVSERYTALMARGSRKENKEPNKGPNHMLRSPLQPTNGHRGKLRMALTVKSLPTKTKTETDVDDPFLATSGKCATQDKGELELPVSQKTDNLEPTISVVATKTQCQPTARDKSVTRKAQLELWRKQKTETEKTKSAKPVSLSSHATEMRKVRAAPSMVHSKPWCTSAKINTSAQKGSMLTVPRSTLHVKHSLVPSAKVKQPGTSLLKSRATVAGSKPLFKEIPSRIAASKNEIRRPLAVPSTGKRRTSCPGSKLDAKKHLVTVSQTRGSASSKANPVSKTSKTVSAIPDAQKRQPEVITAKNDTRSRLNELSTGKRRSMYVGSKIDAKKPLITASRLSSMKSRPLAKVLPKTASGIPDTHKSQSRVTASKNAIRRPLAEPSMGKRRTLCSGSTLDAKKPFIAASRPSSGKPRPEIQKLTKPTPGALPGSPSRRKSTKKFVQVKACVDSNLAGIRSRPSKTFSPRLKYPRGNARHSMPVRAMKPLVMRVDSRQSIAVLRRSPRPLWPSYSTPGRQHPTDKVAVKFDTPAKADSAWARSAVPTAACTPLRKEQSMNEKLSAWLSSRGRTPSKYSHMMCFGHSHGGTTRTPVSHQQYRRKQSCLTPGTSDRRTTFNQPDIASVADTAPDFADETSGQTEYECRVPESEKLEGLLRECLQLLQESDCPAGLVEEWLKELATISQVLHHAKFWIVKALLAEEAGESNDAVVDIFETAFRHKVEPPEEMAAALKGFVDRMSKRHELTTGAHRKIQDAQENVFESSCVKYCTSNTTLFFKRVRSRLDTSPARSLHSIITPVRRSTRKSYAYLPSLLQEHDTIYSALEEVPAELQPCTLFRNNKALGGNQET